MHKFKRKKMAKTHRRANRTRRGGTKTASNATINRIFKQYWIELKSWGHKHKPQLKLNHLVVVE